MRNSYTKAIYGLTVLSLLVMTGCRQSPERVVEKYLEYTFLDNKGKKAYKLLSAEDKSYKTEKEFLKDFRKNNILDGKVIKKYADKYDYEITHVRSNGDSSFVKVRLTKPNAENILNEMVNYAMFTVLTKKNEYEKNASVVEKFNQLLLSSAAETVTEEKEFIVIKENRKYKLFLDLGLPVKKEKIREQVQELKNSATKNEKFINYDAALKTYKKMYSMEKDEEVRGKIDELEYMKKNTIGIGEERQFGNLKFKPEKIEVRRVNMMKMNWYAGVPVRDVSDEEYFVLTFTATNTSKDQIFSYEDENKHITENMVRDNLGNTMHEFGPSYDIYCVEDNEYKKLGPGESRKYKVVCDAPVTMADLFLWEIKLYTDNQKTEERAFIPFERVEILENLKMAQN
ncbi:MAG: hypothetical protein ACK4ND_14570 [Cytophagaceae bacterium]